MKLSRALVLSATLVLCPAGTATADDLWEFTFTGHVNLVTPGLPAPWSDVSLGDACIIRYVFDLEAPDAVPADPSVGSYDAFGFDITLGPTHTTGTASRIDIIVHNQPPISNHTYATYFFIPGPDIAALFLDDTVVSPTELPDALADDHLTPMLNFEAFDSGRLFGIGFNGDPVREVQAVLETFAARQVPAPSAGLLLGAGALVISPRRRERGSPADHPAALRTGQRSTTRVT
ncbi:MAG: hypothetical protein AB7G11_03515 [Phycisphaerales bacterium]